MNKIYNDKIYYIIKFEYYSEEKWALWYTSDKDGVITENGKIYCFDSERSLKIYCKKMNINFEEEVTEYRIDEIERWVNAKVIEVDCQMILKFWNIVDDISESVKKSIYTSGREYVPKWSDEELEVLKNILKQALIFIKKQLSI